MKDWGAEAWVGAAATLCVVVLAGLLAAGLDLQRLAENQAAPAWVQAVGSVVAILIAVAVPAWQARKARAQAQADEAIQAQHSGQMILHTATEILQMFETFIPVRRMDAHGGLDSEALNDVRQRLLAIEQRPLNDDARFAVANLRAAIASVTFAYRRLVFAALTTEEAAEVAKVQAKEVEAVIARLAGNEQFEAAMELIDVATQPRSS